MNYLDLFNDKSELYAEARPTYPQDLYAFLVENCRETENAWDCACGNGQSAITSVEHFSHVNATDVSPNQIAHAFEHPRITYAVCPSEKTPFDAATFDLVCIAQALHWMEYEAFWAEVKRVLKPGGIFAAWGYSWTTINAEIDAVVQIYLLDVIEPYWATQNKLLWNHYRDVPVPFHMLETPTFVMREMWDLRQLITYFHTWSATRRCIDALGEGFFNELYRQLLKVWGNAGESKEIDFDFCCVVGQHKL